MREIRGIPAPGIHGFSPLGDTAGNGAQSGVPNGINAIISIFYMHRAGCVSDGVRIGDADPVAGGFLPAVSRWFLLGENMARLLQDPSGRIRR
jgi:hypothetical protein